MKFHGKIALIQQPRLWGKAHNKHLDPRFSVKGSCFEFSVENVEVVEKHLVYSSEIRLVHENPSNVTFKAEKYPDGFLHGPASSLKSKSIIYPCNFFRCRIDCPCHLCRFKQPLCMKSSSNYHCGDCSLCRKDYDDHLLHHRACHNSCRFCLSILGIFPQFTFTVLEKRSGYNSEPLPVKSYIFYHVYDKRFQHEDVSSQFKCDNCPTSFKRKQDLRRHEISQHFGLKHKCDRCGNNFTRHENLLAHKASVHGKKETKLQCEKCNEIFTKKSNFTRHISGSVHEDGSSKNACDVCDEEFCTNRKLLKHLQTHTVYECVHCQKTFTSKQSLDMQS